VQRGFDLSLSLSLKLIEMSDQYGLPDFRQFMAGRTQYFPAITQPTEPPFFLHRNVAPPLHCEPTTTMVTEVLPRGQLVGFVHHDSTDAAPTAAATTTLCSSQMESGWMGYDGGSTRWPRQETLTLLEIRSRLDSKFKETNQKGPLWDEVSRYIYIYIHIFFFFQFYVIFFFKLGDG